MNVWLDATARAPRREAIARHDVAGGAIVTLERVDMGRKGWRYEVNAEHTTRDAEGPVRKRDTVWMPDHDQAQRLTRAACYALRARTFEPAGLSGLARELGLTFTVA